MQVSVAGRTAFGTTVLPEVDPSTARPTIRDRETARFVPISQLGEGGLGEVVAAVDRDIGRTVAIKRMRADHLSNATLLRFLQEIRTVGRLEHANIMAAPAPETVVEPAPEPAVDPGTLPLTRDRPTADDPAFLGSDPAIQSE